jgi:hypothetical protein
MAELQDTDKFLVNRSNNTRQLSKDKLMAELRDDDLMLVNRAGVSYKATGAEIKDSLKPDEEAPDINAVALTEIENGYRYTDKEFPYTVDMAADGNPPPTYAVKAKLSGTTFNFAVESDAITKVEGGGTNVYTTDTIASVGVANAWDQSQYWQTNLTSNNWYSVNTSSQVNWLFDGDDNTAASFGETAGGYLECTFTNLQVNISVVVHLSSVYGNANPITLTIDGVETTQLLNNAAGERFCTFNVSGSFDKIKIVSNTGYISARSISVDGKQLVNAGMPGDPGAGNLLTFPTDNNFDKFEVGDVVKVDWNRSEEWSKYLTAPNGFYNAPINAFNVLNPPQPDGGWAAITATAGDILTFDASTLNLTGEVEVMAASSHNLSMKGLGSDTVTSLQSGPETGAATGWVSLGTPVGGLEYITSQSSKGTQSNLYAIRVAGKVLVDLSIYNPDAVSITAIDDTVPSISVSGGSWSGSDGSGDQGDGRYEPSQEWSSFGSYTNADFFADRQLTQVFNGVVDGNYVNCMETKAIDKTAVITFNPPLPSSSGVFTLHLANVSSDTRNFGVNGNVVSYNLTSSISTHDVAASEIRTLEFVSESSISSLRLFGIETDGKFFVDSSIPGGGGATDITKTVAYNTKLTVASDKDLSLITGGIYMTDGTVKQDGSGELEPASYTPQTSEIASVNTVDTSTYEYKSHTGQVALGSLTYTSADSGPETVSSGVKPSTSLSDSYWAFIKFNGSAKVNWGPPNSGTTKNVSYFYSDDGVNWVFDSSYSQSSGNFPGPFADSINSAVYWALCYQRTIDGSAITTLNDVPQAPFIPNNWYQFTVPTPLSTLTFNTPNPDLQYFEVGDVVQGQETPTLTATTENNVDEWVTNWNDSNGWTSSTNNMTMTWNISGPANIVFKGVRKSSDNPTMTLSVDGVQVDSVVWGTATAEVSATLPAGNNVVTLKGSRTFRVYSNQSTIDGQFFKINQQASITATDTAANTMTVDGGDWLGQDGSGGDGRYEPTQQWSDGTSTGIRSNSSILNLFDGNPSTYVVAEDASDSEWQHTMTSSITANTSIKFVTTGSGGPYSVGSGDVFETATLTGNEANFVNITYPFTFNQLKGKRTGTQGSGVYEVYVDGKLLVDLSIPGGGGDTFVTGSTETAEGTIQSVDGTEVDLSASTGRWIADNKAGTDFTFVPSTPVVDTRNEAYGKLQIVGDQAMVTGIQADDPGFTSVTRKDYAITFPAAFATGNTPDDDLPAGTSISAIVQAKNSEGESIKESNVLLPSLPNPEGSAGPITGATPTELTVGTSANLDGFVANDALVMVDETGAVASYTPVTSTIANVDVLNAWDQSEIWSSLISSPQGFQSAKELAFNGNLTNNCQTGAGNPAYITFNKTFTNVTKLEVLGRVVSPNPGTLVISGNGITTTNSPTNGMNKVEVPLTSSTISNLRFQINEVQQGVGITGIWINGILLVDAGISGDPGAGSTLTFESPNADLKFFNPGDVLGTATGFNPVLYTGNGGTQSITGVGFSPDLVWIKNRNEILNHHILDTVRGATKVIISNDPARDFDSNQSLQSFDSDGFTVGSTVNVNQSGSGIVAWCWDAGNTTVTNNDGTIESQVRSNGNFSVVKYTGNGSATAEVGHGLKTAPSMFIVKSTNDDFSWFVYHESIGNGHQVKLNSSDAKDTTTYWQNTNPSSSVIYLDGNINNEVAGDGKEFIAYCWAETPGVSSFGSYSGGTLGRQIDCGFKPAFVMIKCSGPANDESWNIHDSARNPSNPVNTRLVPNTSAVESSSAQFNIDFTSTGFTLNTVNGSHNSTGNTYIYAAFAGPNPIEVVDVDVAANTMTVDGGSWTGADGSGDVDGETVATGPEKSGVATFVSTNGTDTMTVENSNLEFITNDNRLGEEFFIKKIFTALNANDPAHVEMQKAVNEAFEAFPKNVQARKTQIAKTFTKLVAGAAITKAELNALRVVVEAAAEED